MIYLIILHFGEGRMGEDVVYCLNDCNQYQHQFTEQFGVMSY